MKEAAGEANMTVVTIIIIAVVVAIATPIIKGMMSSTKEKAECLNNGGVWVNKGCNYSPSTTTDTGSGSGSGEAGTAKS